LHVANKREEKMNKIIITLSALFSITAVAQDVPNTFQPGSPIVASEVNENFQSLKNRIDVLEAQLAEQQAEDTPREFVGITTATTTGAAGGRPGINQMCAAEFPDAGICRYSEIRNASPSSVTGVAWVDNDLILGDYVPFDCENWSSGNGGRALHTVGANSLTIQRSSLICGDERAIACCK
jgi:hypothetical protein